jgi:hypothetical protein
MCVIAICVSCIAALGQTTVPNEARVGLSDRAIALDATNAPALEATLLTKSLNGAADAPVTNIRMIVKNAGTVPYAFVSGIVTFYDASGVRCGEGIFKADALAVNEPFETDTPGIRIRCAATTWRVVATNLLPRVVPVAIPVAPSETPSRLIISVDGESHPIQLDRPITLNLGDRPRTIVVRQSP